MDQLYFLFQDWLGSVFRETGKGWAAWWWGFLNIGTGCPVRFSKWLWSSSLAFQPSGMHVIWVPWVLWSLRDPRGRPQVLSAQCGDAVWKVGEGGMAFEWKSLPDGIFKHFLHSSKLSKTENPSSSSARAPVLSCFLWRMVCFCLNLQVEGFSKNYGYVNS